MFKKITFFCSALLLIHNVSASENDNTTTITKEELQEAIEEEAKMETLMELVKKIKKSDINTETDNGKTILYRLSRTYYPEDDQKKVNFLDHLLKKGANPNKALLYVFYSANTYTRLTDHIFLIRNINNNLLENENKLNVNTQDQDGNTLLHKMAMSNCPQNNDHQHKKRHIIKLIAVGADPTIKNNNNKTPSDLVQEESIKELFTHQSARNIQMPFYKEGRAPRALVYPHENQEVQKSFSSGNLCSHLRNREYGIKNTIHRIGGNIIQSQ